jgi:hypothetical protein
MSCLFASQRMHSSKSVMQKRNSTSLLVHSMLKRSSISSSSTSSLVVYVSSPDIHIECICLLSVLCLFFDSPVWLYAYVFCHYVRALLCTLPLKIRVLRLHLPQLDLMHLISQKDGLRLSVGPSMKMATRLIWMVTLSQWRMEPSQSMVVQSIPLLVWTDSVVRTPIWSCRQLYFLLLFVFFREITFDSYSKYTNI